MDARDLIQKFSDTTENQRKAIFNTLFISANRLQTLFDSRIPDLTLKQFLLLSTLRQTDGKLTLTQLGSILGCSRQNIKKLACILEQKGYITIVQSPDDSRALCAMPTEKADGYFKNEFAVYVKELELLFEGFSPDEVESLFLLLAKLHDGIGILEKKTEKENNT